MSAEPATHLHVVGCQDCERKDRMIAALHVDLDNLEVDLKVKRRRITELLRDRDAKILADTKYSVAEEIYAFWRSKCSPKSRAFGSDRAQAVLARLNDKVPGSDELAYTARYICEAIVGAYVDPYVDPKGKRHNDLELICRTPRKLEDFHDRYERWKARQA